MMLGIDQTPKRQRRRSVCILIFVSMLAVAIYKTTRHEIQIYLTNTAELDVKYTGKIRFSEKVIYRIKSTPFLFIIILSKPNSKIRRGIVRDTWLDLRQHQPMVESKFFFGKEKLSKELVTDIQKEEKEFGDIILLDNLVDSYKTLTRKVLLAMTWVGENVESKFVLKVDDDCLVNVEGLLLLLRTTYVNETRLSLGRFNYNSPILKKGKWRETEWKVCSRYISYTIGMGYVLSFSLVQFIARNSDMLHTYANEDVSVGKN